MFIDEVVIKVQGGNGGRGNVAFFANKSGPSGGNGGDGGNVLVEINPQLASLYKYLSKTSYKGNSGTPGQRNRAAGAAGEDLFLQVPIGTSIIDLDTETEVELTSQNTPFLIAKGGRGGLGNDAFKSSTNRTPQEAEPGIPGELHHYKLILKLIADYGFIGLPNAGKSSLLNELTAANVKTANYAFTTLEPNLGVLDRKVLADIPGLIEGASHGRGLGIKFLKHIEKVKLLLHCISSESENMDEVYQTVITELGNYNQSLLQKKSIILLTKADLLTPDEVVKRVKELKKFNKEVYPISIHDYSSLEKLKKILI